MNYLTKSLLHKMFIATLIASLFVFPSFVLADVNISVESTVIFNTACARCHEGQCSGRMTFNLPKDATNQHIIRHGGKLSEQRIQQLFKLLRYMKEECSFYPLPLALMNDKIWEGQKLNKFQSSSNQAYFIPLGHLEPGEYQLLFEEQNNTNFCVEIINDEFDFIDKESLNDGDGEQIVQFQVDERAKHFLRLTAQEAMTINKLELLILEQKDKRGRME